MSEEVEALRDAIRILDVLKGRVVHENLDAWFALYHAKCYLKAQLIALLND